MTRFKKEMAFVLLALLLPFSAAHGEIDLAIPSPAVSIQADFYSDNPVILSPGTEIMPPIPPPVGGLISLNLRASNFPQGAPSLIDCYLILRAAETGKTYYAEFDILKLLAGGFDLAEAISLSETRAPFLRDLTLTSDIDVMIPVRTRDIDVSQDNFYVIAVFTTAGTDIPVGNRAVGKIHVSGPNVCCYSDRPAGPAAGK